MDSRFISMLMTFRLFLSQKQGTAIMRQWNKWRPVFRTLSLWCMLNEKTELLVVTSTRQKGKVTIPGLKVGSHYITLKQSARNIGIMFDDSMNMEAQINTICQKAYFHHRNIKSIRKCLAYKATEQLIHAFVTSTLDNGNALLDGLPASLLSKLQRIQNTAARILTLTPKYDHITPVLQSLHWLPVSKRYISKFSWCHGVP